MNKVHINITLDNNILNWIDLDRGQEARSAFINKILSTFHKKEKEVFDWGIEEKQAEQDIKKGNVQKLKTAKDAIKWLKN